MIEQYQHQRQRVMMVFGKQNSAEAVDKANNTTSRSMPASNNDKRLDDTSSNQEPPPTITTTTTISKLLPIQPDNIPMNLLSRHDATNSNQITSTHRV